MELLRKIFSYSDVLISRAGQIVLIIKPNGLVDIAEVSVYTLCIATSDISISWSLHQHVYIVVDLSASVNYKSRNEFLPDISIAFLYVLHSYVVATRVSTVSQPR